MGFPLMNDNHWAAIRGRLEADGFAVDLESLYYQQRQPFWRARATRDGRSWCASGGDMDAIFTELAMLARSGARPASHPPKESLARVLRSVGRAGGGRFSAL